MQPGWWMYHHLEWGLSTPDPGGFRDHAGSMATTAPVEAPLTARSATSLWLVAVGAGVAETVVQVVGASADGASTSSLAGQIAVRAVIYGALFVVIDRYFRRGVRWSRYLLAGLLGTVGVASLVSEPIGWAIQNGDFSTIKWSAMFFTIAALRWIHLTAVLTALALTLHPQTTRWFRDKSPKAGLHAEDRPSG